MDSRRGAYTQHEHSRRKRCVGVAAAPSSQLNAAESSLWFRRCWACPPGKPVFWDGQAIFANIDCAANAPLPWSAMLLYATTNMTPLVRESLAAPSACPLLSALPSPSWLHTQLAVHVFSPPLILSPVPTGWQGGPLLVLPPFLSFLPLLSSPCLCLRHPQGNPC